MSSPAQAPSSSSPGNAPSNSAPPITSVPPVQSPIIGSPLLQSPPVQSPIFGSPPAPIQAPPLVSPVASSPPPIVVLSPPPAPVLSPPPQSFASPPPPDSTTPPPAVSTPPSQSTPAPPPPQEQSTPAPPPPQEQSTPAAPPKEQSIPSPPPDTSSGSSPPPARSFPSPSENSSPPPAGNSSPSPAEAPPVASRVPPRVSVLPPPVISPPVPPSFTALIPPPSSSSNKLSTTTIGGLAAGGLIGLALVAICLFCFFKRKPRREDYRSSPQFYVHQKPGAFYDVERRGQYDSGFYSTGSSGTGQPMYQSVAPASANSVHGSSNANFTYEELAQATSGFSRANMLGEGGFGCVYKGVLPGGQEVAVKQLKIGGGQGEREFRAEVEIITRIHHRHLVTLVGYCIDANHRLLVYEFVPNGTLDYHLHGKGKQGKAAFDWSMRMKTAVGSSRGLAYLHEDCHPKIIHRDIKSSNILLDNNFEAQVADFGLAKLASDAHTHVTTRVMGTFGYLAPEYASSGKLTDKSDVYSFGVVLLELITGRKPVDTSQPLGEESLVEWSRPLITQALETGNFDELVDPLLPEYNPEEMMIMIRTAAACVRHSASKRPKMSQIVRILESDADSKGGFNDLTTEHDTALHSADLRMFRRMALATSQEYGSEYSGATSEYGVNPSISSGEFDSKERPRRTTDESEWPLRQ